MIHNSLRPTADSAGELAGQSNRTATGTEAYAGPRDGLAEETAPRTTTPQQDPAYDEQRGDAPAAPSTEQPIVPVVTAP